MEQFQVGERRFVTQKKLGEGAFGVVYEVNDQASSPVFAQIDIRTDSNFQDLQCTNHEYEPLTTRILQSKKATPLIYKKLISNKSLTPGSSQKKWLKDLTHFICTLKSQYETV